jgi:hypothetical protein
MVFRLRPQHSPRLMGSLPAVLPGCATPPPPRPARPRASPTTATALAAWSGLSWRRGGATTLALPVFSSSGLSHAWLVTPLVVFVAKATITS